jgi:hypothetical protein
LILNGGQGVNRTPDTKIFSLLLYRLSYLPTGTASVGLDGGLNSYLSGMSLATAVWLQVLSLQRTGREHHGQYSMAPR